MTNHSNSEYRPDIDGLRAVAVLSVVIYHAFEGHMPGGFVGVDIFFVISGFLISSILLKDLAAGRFSILKFYSRRIRRIFPALFVVLLACVAFGWARLSAEEYARLGKHTAAAAGFVSNLLSWSEAGYFDESAVNKPLLHLWSLGVEEQFYLFWPMMLFLFAMRPRLLPLALGCVIVLSFANNIHDIASSPVASFYSPLSRFWELVAGATLAKIELRPQSRLAHALTLVLNFAGGKGREAIALIGAALIGGSCFLLTRFLPFPGWWALLPVVGAAFIILAGPTAWFNRTILSNRYAVAIGLISYPLYLWHWPLLSLSRTLVPGGPPIWLRATCIVLAVALAAATYQVIEKPIRWRWKPRMAVMALLTGVTAVGAFGYVTYEVGGFSNRPTALAFAEAERFRREDEALRKQYTRQKCGNETWVVGQAKAEASCYRFGTGVPRKRIALWGDSHASAWAPAFFQIAREQNYSVVEFSISGCPPLLHTKHADNYLDDHCNDFGISEDVLASIRNFHPDVTVLIARWDMYANGWFRDGKLSVPPNYLTSQASGRATLETSRQALTSSVPDTISALLAGTTGDILILKAPPQLPHYIFPDQVRFAQTLSQSRTEHEEREEFVTKLFARESDRPRIKLFDPTDYFCQTECSAVIGGLPMYSDDNHISAFGALIFKDELLSAIGSSD